MADEVAYTPQRIRSFASLTYRLAAGNPAVREVGNFLARCAEAADEQGDLLQQRDHLKAELARLQQATAEAERYRLRVLELERDLAAALKVAAAARVVAGQERHRREELEHEVRGSRLWWELARLLLEEAQPLLPADKAKIVDVLGAAKLAASDRGRLAKAEALLRRCQRWVSLAAQNDADAGAAALARDIVAHLEEAS